MIRYNTHIAVFAVRRLSATVLGLTEFANRLCCRQRIIAHIQHPSVDHSLVSLFLASSLNVGLQVVLHR